MKEGWEPLCKFLGVPIPTVGFPHKNKGADIIKELVDNHPLVIRMIREATVSLTLIAASTGYLIYNIATNSYQDSILGYPFKICDYVLSYWGYSKIT